jgi:hypothetical protein
VSQNSPVKASHKRRIVGSVCGSLSMVHGQNADNQSTKFNRTQRASLTDRQPAIAIDRRDNRQFGIARQNRALITYDQERERVIIKKSGNEKKVGVPFRKICNERLPVGAGRERICRW